MKFHSEMAAILDRIANVRWALRQLVIAIDKPRGDSPWYDRGSQWEDLAERLEETLDTARSQNSELQEVLYQRGLGNLGVIGSKPQAEQAPPLPELIHPQVQMALDFLKTNGPSTAATIAAHLGVLENTFRRHYAKPLKALGVRNERDGDGYYIPET
jgi:hypothetical protein